MSHSIYLAHGTGDDWRPCVIDGDLDAELRALTPRRVAGTGWDYESVNVTYNLTPMLREAGMQSWRDFHGMRAEDAAPLWEAVIAELRRDPAKYQALNPPNGWGTYDGVLEALLVLVAGCHRHPDAIVAVL